MIILKLCGMNDTKPQNWQDIATFTRDFRAMLDHFRGLKSKPQIWVCTPVPVYKDNWGINARTLDTGVIPALMDECGRRKVPVIDLNDASWCKSRCFPTGSIPMRWVPN